MSTNALHRRLGRLAAGTEPDAYCLRVVVMPDRVGELRRRADRTPSEQAELDALLAGNPELSSALADKRPGLVVVSEREARL
jgi:hypothetical protein